MKLSVVVLVVSLVVCASSAAVIPGEPDFTMLWNNFSAVSVVDSFAVTSSPSGIAVLVRGPSGGSYRQINQHFLPVEPFAHKQYDSVLVIRTHADVLYFMNLNTLPDIVILGYADLGGPFEDFALSDQDLYVAMGFDGLWRYRLSSYNNAQFADSSMLGIHYTRVESYGQEILALDDYNGILRYDVRSDGFADFRDYLFLPFQARSFVRADSLLIIAVAGPRLLVGDLSLSPPVVIDTVPLMFPAARVFARNDQVAVFNRAVPALEVFDIENRTPYVVELARDPDTSFNGDQFVNADTVWCMLPGADGGLAVYEVVTGVAEPVGQSVLDRPGPIQTVMMRDGTLYTGGERNPLERFAVDTDDGPSFDTTFYPGLRGVRTVAFNGDTLLVLYADLGRILMLDITNDTLPFLGSITPNVIGAREIVLANRRLDTLGAMFVIGTTGVEVFSVSDSGGVVSRGILGSIDDITDAAFVDSLLFVATRKTGIRVYRLYNNFTAEYRSTISFAIPPTRIQIYNGRLLTFSVRDLHVYTVTDPRNIARDTIVYLPRAVTWSAIDQSMLYTVGYEGMCIFDLNGPAPELLDQGGRPGSLISVERGLAAVTDGNAVNIYRLLGVPTGINDDHPALPAAVQLEQNYPNPFNPSTSIRYALNAQTDVNLTVFNVLGQSVTVLIDGVRPAGVYEIEWDGRNRDGLPVASGVYFYRMVAGDVSVSRKMILLK